MRVVAFGPALSVDEDEDGGLSARGFPLTVGFVDSVPTEITLQIVVSVCALNGGEHEPVIYLGATSPQGERVSTMEFRWFWEDHPEVPVKYRVFTQHLPILVESEGVYTLGLYGSPSATETQHIYPLPMFLNPGAPSNL